MTNEKKQHNKRKKLYYDFTFIGTLIFLLFRIPLTNIIGTEGNGYFSVSWELYTLFGLIFGTVLSNVTGEMVRRRFRKNHYQNAANVLTTALFIGFILSLLGAAAIYFSSNVLLKFLSVN